VNINGESVGRAVNADLVLNFGYIHIWYTSIDN
jgi:hypothetical protein